jgi:hypothetical protein
MSVAVKADPALWGRVKRKWLRSEKGGVAGKWNARKAMLAVQEYKMRGGTYIGPPSRDNSLKKWAREDWGYIDGDPAGRYLPAAVRSALTSAEKQREKRLKRGRAGEWVPYSASVNAKMLRAGIYGPKAAVARSKAAAKPKAAARAKAAAKPKAAATPKAAAKPKAAARAKAAAKPKLAAAKPKLAAAKPKAAANAAARAKAAAKPKAAARAKLAFGARQGVTRQKLPR